MLIKTDEAKNYTCPVMSGRGQCNVPCLGKRCAWYINAVADGYGYCVIMRFRESDLGDGRNGVDDDNA